MPQSMRMVSQDQGAWWCAVQNYYKTATILVSATMACLPAKITRNVLGRILLEISQAVFDASAAPSCPVIPSSLGPISHRKLPGQGFRHVVIAAARRRKPVLLPRAAVFCPVSTSERPEVCFVFVDLQSTSMSQSS